MFYTRNSQFSKAYYIPAPLALLNVIIVVTIIITILIRSRQNRLISFLCLHFMSLYPNICLRILHPVTMLISRSLSRPKLLRNDWETIKNSEDQSSVITRRTYSNSKIPRKMVLIAPKSPVRFSLFRYILLTKYSFFINTRSALKMFNTWKERFS
jgi:hypothetical protein